MKLREAVPDSVRVVARCANQKRLGRRHGKYKPCRLFRFRLSTASFWLARMASIVDGKNARSSSCTGKVMKIKKPDRSLRAYPVTKGTQPFSRGIGFSMHARHGSCSKGATTRTLVSSAECLRNTCVAFGVRTSLVISLSLPSENISCAGSGIIDQ